MKLIFKKGFHMRRLHTAAIITLLGLAVPSTAAADRRSFTHTYEYMTMSRGQTELEIYTTQSRATFDDNSPQSFELMLEIEHGITDRWDVSMYHVFKQSTGDGMTDPGEPLHFDELKLRSRYRLAERGEWPVDVLVYGELVKSFGSSVYEAETKAILARDFGLLTAVVNPVVAIEFGGDVAETELELGWAAGLTYEVSPRIKLGAESWGGFEAEAADQVAASVGPAVSWAPADSLWVSVTAGFGLTDTADDFSVRALIGLGL